MANIAECAIAIAKTDIDMLNGAFKRTGGDDTRCRYGKSVIKKTYENDATGETIYLFDINYGAPDYARKIGLKKDGRIIKEYEGNCRDGEYIEILDWLTEQGYHLADERYTKDEFYEDGWCVDFAKLHTYSYGYEPRIKEYDDCVVLWFGGKWDFPNSLNDYLNSKHVAWQGAGLDDGMAWQCDAFGNTYMGLRIGEDTDYDGDEPYKYHFIEYHKEEN